MPKFCVNSSQIDNGDVFFAIPCNDIEHHVEEAKARGASMIFVPNNFAHNDQKFIRVNDVRKMAAGFACFLYPRSPQTCVAVTGTNGKSSVVHFLRQIWHLSGKKSASLGTNGLVASFDTSEENVPNLTTPGPFEFHKITQYLADHDVTHFAFEASSHALEQKRVHFAKLAVAAMTNFGTDHLDYHISIENYFNAKKRLFTEIGAEKTVVSKDEEDIYGKLAPLCKNCITFGFMRYNDFYAQNIREIGQHILCDFYCLGKKYLNIELKLFGSFQLLNVLCAMAIANQTGIELNMIINAVSKLQPLDGRMEYICTYNGGDIYIDFAHTTDAFLMALQTFHNVTHRKLIIVFGCGGERDPSKRPLFGNFAEQFADVIIVTDDNPRSENPAQIRAEIISQCQNAIEISDREKAIRYAISLMQKGDVLAIIGRGNEKCQQYNGKKILKNDKEIVLKAIKEDVEFVT